MVPQIKVQLPVATMCITIPITPLPALTVEPCINETTIVNINPAIGP